MADTKEGKLSKRPQYTSNLISAAHFYPSNQLINTGVKRTVTLDDLWELKGDTRTDVIEKHVKKRWAAELLKETPSLTKVLLGLSSGLFVASLFLLFLNMMAQLVPSIVLPYLIEWITYDKVQYDAYYAAIALAKANNITLDFAIELPGVPEHPERYWGWIWAAIVSASGILAAYFEAHGMVWVQEACARLRAGIMVLVYQKALSASAAASPPSGKIMTLLTSDVNIIGMMLPQTFQFIMTPLQLIAIMVLLWRQIGAYSLISLGFLILVMPFAGITGKKMFTLFGERQAASDTRVKLITELVQAIRIVKYYAWERPMGDNIEKARKQELHMLRRVFNWAAGLFLTIGTAPVIATGLTFIFYGIYAKPNLSAIFTALNLLTMMRFVFFMLPSMFQGIAQILASIGRVQEYLMTPDAEQSVDFHEASESSPPRVVLEKASFKWSAAPDATNALTDVSLTLEQSKRLTMVAGLVGSGKSALAQALLGQLFKLSGEINVTGSIAYVPQTAWIMNASVRDNILFGKAFDQERYDMVTQAVSLISDLKLMPAGDATEIGERGVNLSGGQKQRISIARALYSDRDVYILDDPLSAVDAHVGKHIFREAIQGVLKDKVVLLITNNLGFLPDADEIIYLVEGKMSAQGSFRRLLKSNEKFKALMDEHGIFANKKDTKGRAKKDEDDTVHDKKAAQYEEEDKEEGGVSGAVYAYYLRNAGWLNFSIVVVTLALQAASQVAMQWWLQFWPEDYVARRSKGLSDLGTNYYIGIYSALNFVGVIFTVITFFYAIQLVFRSARKMHRAVTKRTLRAPISFFDTTPMGRIIARFSTDISIIDTQILGSIWQALQAFFTVLGALASVALGTYWILLAVPPFAAIYFYVQFRYRKTSIAVQRLEALTRGPLFSHFSETLSGINTIRAYKKQTEFFAENKRRLDEHNGVYFALRYTQSWFSFVLGLLGSVLQIATYFIIVALVIYTNENKSLFVVAIAAAPQITQMLKMLATAVTNLEVQMNAVERIEEYTHLPEEPPAIIDDKRPDENWPSKGEIEFENFSYRYRDGLPLVLKNISLKLRGGERVGIVGRTGSGKSTLLGALYRLAEPAEDRVVIDGIDTTTIGVEDLRSKLSIIPQEPQLFVGSLRYNIDPFGKHTDEELWSALKIAGLKDFVASLTNKLDEAVIEGGGNFSVGQRQLLCLARALLRQSKVLVLDEATASVDFDTDVLIQKAIRTSFPNTTLLVIAHRLNTVMDMNRIVALQQGEVQEFDSPKNLVQNKKSMLYGMIKATGKANAKHLKKLAMGESDIIEVLKATAGDKAMEVPASPPVTEKSDKKSKKSGSSKSGAKASKDDAPNDDKTSEKKDEQKKSESKKSEDKTSAGDKKESGKDDKKKESSSKSKK